MGAFAIGFGFWGTLYYSNYRRTNNEHSCYVFDTYMKYSRPPMRSLTVSRVIRPFLIRRSIRIDRPGFFLCLYHG